MNRYAGVNPANGDALWYTKDGELTTEFREEDKVMTGKRSTLHGRAVSEPPSHGKASHCLRSSAGWPTAT